MLLYLILVSLLCTVFTKFTKLQIIDNLLSPVGVCPFLAAAPRMDGSGSLDGCVGGEVGLCC